MISNFEEVKIFTQKILQKVQVFRYTQLVEMLNRKFNFESDISQSAIIDMQRRGYFIIEDSGYIITKQLYIQWSHDKFLDNISKNNEFSRLKMEFPIYSESNIEGKITYTQVGTTSISNELKNDRYRYDSLKSMWIIASYIPDSEDFISCDRPFNLSFLKQTEDGNNTYLYQIMNTSTNDILAKRSMLFSAGKIDERFTDSIFRIAIIEKEEHADLIPHLGFGMIVMLNKNENNQIITDPDTGALFKVIEARLNFKDRWSDN